MKLIQAFAVTLFLVVASFASVVDLSFVSHESGANIATDMLTASNSPGGPDVPIYELTPNPAWYELSGAPYVSTYNSGDPADPGYVQVPNGTEMYFLHRFFVPINYSVIYARLSVVADDSASGRLNGQNLFGIVTVPAYHCAAYAPGCQANTVWTGDIPAHVFPGLNELIYTIRQQWTSSTGFAYRLDIRAEGPDSPPVPEVPEPGTWALAGLGFALIAFGRKFRRGVLR